MDAPGFGDAGGLNVHVRALGGQLSALGWDVEILTRRTGSQQPESLRTDDGVLVRYLEAGPTAMVPKEELPRVVNAFATSIDSVAPFDIYHSHYWLSAAAVQASMKAQSAPHVLSLHTVGALKNRHLAAGQPSEPAGRLRDEGRLARGAAAVIAATDAERDALAELYGVDAARIEVIEPGVDVTLFHPRSRLDVIDGAREAVIDAVIEAAHDAARDGVSDRTREGAPHRGREGAPDRRRTRDGSGDNVNDDMLREVAGDLLVVGRVQPLKRQDLAIRALSRIDPPHRPRLILVGDVSGPSGGYPEHLRALVAARGLETDVVFAGAESRDRVAELMAASAVVLIPSASETYGLVALEAAASGIPVIATASAGLFDSVDDGTTGILVPRSEDPVEEEWAWASRIVRVVSDRPLWERLSRSAIARASDRTWEATARRTAAVYERALQERSLLRSS
ncbi:MAG TPA: glycosyltransferase [Nitrolancea sp.]|nr:glycosyltransferase [Nitrolancea sp.]